MMNNTPETEEDRAWAFVAAALVLLVLPLVVLFGLVALGLTTYAGFLSDLGELMTGDTAWFMYGMLAVWIALVVTGIVVIANRVSRRAS
jgi:hypothetical protein